MSAADPRVTLSHSAHQPAHEYISGIPEQIAVEQQLSRMCMYVVTECRTVAQLIQQPYWASCPAGHLSSGCWCTTADAGNEMRLVHDSSQYKRLLLSCSDAVMISDRVNLWPDAVLHFS